MSERPAILKPEPVAEQGEERSLWRTRTVDPPYHVFAGSSRFRGSLLPPVAIAERRLTRLVLVVSAEPVLELSFLVAPPWRAVEQPVVGHRGLEAAGGRDVGPVDGAVVQGVRAQAGTLRDVAGDVGAGGVCHLLDNRGDLAFPERLQPLPGR